MSTRTILGLIVAGGVAIAGVVLGQPATPPPPPAVCWTRCDPADKYTDGCCKAIPPPRGVSPAACNSQQACGPACNTGNPAACRSLVRLQVDDCEKKHDQASCVAAAWSLWIGHWVARDPKKSGALLELACKADFPQGCVEQARRVASGVGAAPDLAAAKALATKALGLLGTLCKEKGDADACMQESGLAKGMAVFGVGGQFTQVLQPALVRAADAAQRGCDFGSPLACLQVAQRLALVEPLRAAAVAATACERSNVHMICAMALGFAARTPATPGAPGAPVPPWVRKIAARLTRLAELDCTQGDGVACYALDAFYSQGIGGPKNPALSDRFAARGAQAFRTACFADWERCLFLLGSTLPSGLIHQADLARLLKDRARANCGSGLWKACLVVLRHDPLARDEVASALLKSCSDKKDSAACIFLSQLFPDRLRPIKTAITGRCDVDKDGDACYALAVEPWVPTSPQAAPPADRKAAFTKACLYSARSCLLQPPWFGILQTPWFGTSPPPPMF